MKLIKAPRIFHPYQKWECYNNGFYDVSTTPDDDTLIEIYKDFFNGNEFSKYIDLVFNNWNNSCEHFLTNPNMNRIAWLGQACITYKYGISVFNCKYVYKSLNNIVIEKSNLIAFNKIQEYLNELKEKNK